VIQFLKHHCRARPCAIPAAAQRQRVSHRNPTVPAINCMVLWTNTVWYYVPLLYGTMDQHCMLQCNDIVWYHVPGLYRGVCTTWAIQYGSHPISFLFCSASAPRRAAGQTFSDRQLVEELASLADIKDTAAFDRSFRDQMDVLE